MIFTKEEGVFMDISDLTNKGAPKDLSVKVNYSPRYSKETIKKLENCVEKVKKAVLENELTMGEFHNLRLKNSDLLNDEQIDKIKAIRESIEKPTEDTLLQKAISRADFEKYLNGKVTVKGFVTRAQDTKDLKSYMDFYECLRLDYENSEFLPEKDDSLYLIRFKTDEVDNIYIPYNIRLGGNRNFKPPTSGNGFTSARNNEIVPEYRFSQEVTPFYGAEIYEITKDGEEFLRAVYDKRDKKFKKIER